MKCFKEELNQNDFVIRDMLKKSGKDVIVAVNKIDKPSANIERVKQELTEYELIAEDWGGSTIFVPVSAKTGEGIEELMEMIYSTQIQDAKTISAIMAYAHKINT